jgi:hypothetical protein
MLLAWLEYAGRISWRLDRDDPPLIELSKTSPWFLLNPLLYCALPQPTSDHFEQFSPGRYYGLTTGIVLVTDNEDIIRAHRSRTQIDDLLVAERLLTALRHLARQATIPTSEALVRSYFEMDELPTCQPAVLAPERYTVQKYWFVTATTVGHLRAAAALGLDFVPSTYEVLLLDSIAAHRGGDYRKAVLYAAMSAEIAFGSVIDEEYERIIASRSDVRFRVIAMPQAGGKSVQKDPIYERLRGRSDFNALIHELSLYVLGRSLLAEDERLYQNAKRLYLTRNKLAHLGELPEGDVSQLYPLDAKGALGAIATTVSLFAWLGEPADFPLPETAFVVARDLAECQADNVP